MKHILTTTMLCFVNLIYAQNSLTLAYIDSVHSDYMKVFEAYSKTIRNGNKSIVFVYVGSSSSEEITCIEDKIPDYTLLRLRLVSELEKYNLLFEEQKFGDMPLLGYIGIGPTTFIIYSETDLCIPNDESKSIGKFFFDDYDLRGHPTFVWDVIVIEGQYYKKTDM